MHMLPFTWYVCHTIYQVFQLGTAQFEELSQYGVMKWVKCV